MRIAIATEGTRGDVAPMLFLAQALHERGHTITFAAPSGFQSLIEERGFRFGAASADVHSFMAKHALAIACGGLRAARAFDDFGRKHIGCEFDASFAVARDADLMIAAGVQLGAASAAEAAGIPYRYVAYCPALFPSQEHPPFVLPWMGFSPRVNRWLWRLFLPAFSLAAGHQVNRERRLRGLGSLGNVFDHFVTANPVLATDAALAGIPGDVGAERRVLGIPALYPLGGELLPEKLETFLQSGPPPVYVGFGSMTDPDPRATTRLVLEAIERVGCRAVLSSGWAGLGDAALPSTVMVVNEVSHASLFPHCAAVVHHGGAGTTTSAARAGVRQLVVPHVVDQFYWGSRVQRHGVAPQPLPRKRLAAEPLAATLRALLDNELAAERAEELGARLHDEYPRRFRPDAILDADGHS